MTIANDLKTALADRYQIERELGQGGMATVFLAHDVRHRRKVAIKVLKPELALAVGPERFLREIEIAAGLRHPHILPLHDSGEAAGYLYYVMPLVEGESLQDRLAREKQLPLDDAIRIAREVADALSYAHAHGVVHRDIKPANIMLESGHAVVADFGIARLVGSAAAPSLTATGMSVGTPAYMSPEQAAGDSTIDGRSDLYSLACVLYEMLAGQPPFTGPNVESVVRQHLGAEPRPISQLRPAVPPDVAMALQRALSKTPADRFNPVAQFADALSLRQPAVVPGSRPRRLVPVVLAVGLLAAVLVILLLRGRPAAPTAAGRPSIAVLPFQDVSGGTNEYLGDGLAETLINALSKLEGLQVASRTSTFAYKGRSEDVRTIGEQLNVRSVLEGSVQRAGDRLRVTAQLINTGDGFQLWSENFDRDAGDIFAVQDEVARAVVAALRVQLGETGPDELVEEGTRNLTAYDAYLLGRFHWNKRDAENLLLATRAFEAAIEADSNYALAWTGLAETYQLYLPSEYNVTVIPWREALARAEAAARRAIRIDSTLAIAWSALGGILDKGNRGVEAEQQFRRALKLDPEYATAHQWYGGLLLSSGRYEEGLAAMRRAAELDPASMVIGVEVAEALDALGRVEEASQQYERVLAVYPTAYLTNVYAWIHFGLAGNFERAADLLENFLILATGDSARARAIASRVRQPSTRAAALREVEDIDRSPQAHIAIPLMLGDAATAIARLDRALDAPDSRALVYTPHIASIIQPSLGRDPRAQAILTEWRRKYYRKS